MINTNKKSAFTLVELIVVITILAILATIAFISLSGYSADAKNSKVVTDLNSIQSSITNKLIDGMPLLSFITKDDNRSPTIIGTTYPSVGGLDTTSTNFIAGVANFKALDAKAEEFTDPNAEVAYSLAATTKAGGVFEVAGKITIDNTFLAKVKGTYTHRLATSVNATIKEGNKKVVLAAGNVNTFKANDTVTLKSGSFIITKVARDGLTLTLNNLPTDVDASDGNIVLAGDEVTGLTGNGTLPVVNESGAVLPY